MIYNSKLLLIPICAALLHIIGMEWVYPYRRYMQRKLRTIHRRIQLTEYDNETN